MNRFTYIYDTYCGWCYGAAPVIRTLIESGAEVTVMHRYLFQGAQAHRMGDGFGAQAWGYDQRIAALSGQKFSETYRQNILQNPDEVLESGLTAQAAALVRNQGAEVEMRLASTLQKLRYVDGISAADADVVQRVLKPFGVTTPLASAANAAREMSEQAAKIAQLSGVQGVPVLLLHRDIRTRPIDISALYNAPEKIRALAACPPLNPQGVNPMKTLLTTTALAVFATAAQADLSITAYYPNEGSLFPVASGLIEGDSEIILVDAQFERDDAQELVEMIRASGKTLTTIYISHKDPDFYFGVDAVHAAFPEARIIATPSTVKGIEATIQLKYDFWGPILGENAPQDLIVPEVFEGDSLTVDGETVRIIGLDGHDPVHTFLWVPGEETVLGGVPLYENQHVWMSDTQTPESRDDWRATLDQIEALNPKRIIAGHSVGDSAEDSSIVDFTRSYVAAFEAAAAEAANSEELVAAMQAAYPDFAVNSSLEIGAAVIMGERSWP